MPSPSECLFCRIASGDISAAVVAESERVVAFLDIAPIRPGHVQVVPRDHHASFDDLPPDLLLEMSGLAQRLARALKRIYGVERVGFAFTGTDIPHAHAHVVPLVAPDDLTSRRYIVEPVVTYRNPPRPTDAELAEIATALRLELSKADEPSWREAARGGPCTG